MQRPHRFASVVLTVLSICLLCPGKELRGDDAQAAADHAVVEALLRLPAPVLDGPEQHAAIRRYLSRLVGTKKYIDVAQRLNVTGNTDELLAMASTVPFEPLAIDAAKRLVAIDAFDALQAGLEQHDSEKASSVATALGYVGHARVMAMLQEIVRDASANRQLRIAATDALGRSLPGQKFLLQLAKQGSMGEDIRFSVTNSLLSSKDTSIRQQARQVVQPPESKSEAIPPVAQLVKMRGDGKRGREVFHTTGTCIKCHQVGDQGKEVGPNLSEIGSKLSREDMFVAILNPSAAVSHNYETYTLLDANGKVLSGLLMNQTDDEVTLRDAEGIDHTVVSDEVESLKKQSISLMPADLQKAMSLQDLLDLVDYLVLLRKPEQRPFHTLAGGPEIDTSHDPTRAIAGFEIADGLQVELFAYEPQLLSPTSIDVDALGRIWVCEAVNYRHFRNPDNQEREQGDRILVLEDTDHDGRADKETVFFQDKLIDSPHGVCVIGKSTIVSAGENVIVFRDENNDLQPESHWILFSGISGVQHDHGIHAFGVGPDGKLYFNFGNEGKQLRGPNGETLVDLAGNVVNDSGQPYRQGMVFRCNPDGSELETLGWNFRNNWEVCVDSFGTMWQSDNDDDGNRGTRINYVMQYGNYGYQDERTGASWRAERIGLESEIPLQHWHLNDPGVIPNILQTGAGSPTGICVYEGDLLPPAFRNQVIHTDPGPNVVRAYPVEQDGAGYRASILNLIKGVNDPWFRPVDVCAAPDGSLFVADWYDPGVGGHRMGDTEHGRIFRIVPTGHSGYHVPELDFETASGAVAALQSPNLATRYLAQQALARLGPAALPALERLASSGTPRMQARSLWQLGLVSSNPTQYVDQALASSNSDLRILGIRMAVQHDADILSVVEQLKRDPSPQVRRELALALRGNPSPQAAELWVDLAVQHDGQDRWYLEALGIGADQQWDEFFQAWLDRVGDDWNTPAGRDIVWRCRSPLACQYLAQIIRDTDDVQEQYRYFRAFDFHEGPPKIEALMELTRL